MLIGAFLEFVNCFAVVGIAVLLFSVLKSDKTVARFYVSFRIIDCTILIIGVISGLLLITLSQEYIKVSTLVAPYFQTISILALKAKNLTL